MQWVKNNNFIVAGNGTIYKNHEQEYNPSIHFLIDLKKSRDSMKSAMKKLDPSTYEYAVKAFYKDGSATVWSNQFTTVKAKTAK